MRIFATISFLAVLATGCRSAETVRAERLAQWRSARSTAKQKFAAATQLVPLGTTQGKAQEVLGQPTRRMMFHGPIIYSYNYIGPTNRTFAAEYTDYYDCAGGDYVALTFDLDPPVNSWEDHPLVAMSLGHTNYNLISTSTMILPTLLTN